MPAARLRAAGAGSAAAAATAAHAPRRAVPPARATAPDSQVSAAASACHACHSNAGVARIVHFCGRDATNRKRRADTQEPPPSHHHHQPLHTRARTARRRRRRALSAALPWRMRPKGAYCLCAQLSLFVFPVVSLSFLETHHPHHSSKPTRCVEGRIAGGIGAVPGFGWWPIKAYRPCPALEASGRGYTR